MLHCKKCSQYCITTVPTESHTAVNIEHGVTFVGSTLPHCSLSWRMEAMCGDIPFRGQKHHFWGQFSKWFFCSPSVNTSVANFGPQVLGGGNRGFWGGGPGVWSEGAWSVQYASQHITNYQEAWGLCEGLWKFRMPALPGSESTLTWNLPNTHSTNMEFLHRH